MMGNYHVRCGAGEKPEVATPEAYLSLFGRIPGFVEKLSTMRSYRLSCTIILQNLAQLKKLYQDDMGTIIGNCDTFIFLGSQEKDMIEYIESFLGKTTKRQQSMSVSHGKMRGNSESFQFTAASLMAFNEIREMDDDDCIVFLRGQKPFFRKKFDLRNHPKYNLTGAANDDYKYIIRLDNRKKIDEERDEEQIEKDKEKRYDAGGSKGGDRVISMPVSVVEVFNRICEGDPSKLKERIVIESEPEPIAETQEEKRRAEAAFEETKEIVEEYEQLDDGPDIWDSSIMDMF